MDFTMLVESSKLFTIKPAVWLMSKNIKEEFFSNTALILMVRAPTLRHPLPPGWRGGAGRSNEFKNIYTPSLLINGMCKMWLKLVQKVVKQQKPRLYNRQTTIDEQTYWQVKNYNGRNSLNTCISAMKLKLH